MTVESERTRILQMIEDGLVSVDEGIALIQALETRNASLPENFVDPLPAIPAEPVVEQRAAEVPFAEMPASEPQEPPAGPEPVVEDAPPSMQDLPGEPPVKPEFDRWRGYWWIPLWVGVGITVLSAGLMYLALQKSGMGFWFACTWFPFALGVLVMALAWASRTARWLHVRIHQKPGERPQRISISLPLPIRLTAWFVRTFRGHIPGLEFSGLDEVILALQKTNPDTPFYVEVNEGEDGERVEVYLG